MYWRQRSIDGHSKETQLILESFDRLEDSIRKMVMSDVTLFIGNGINYFETQEKYSWKQVLVDLARKIDGQSLLDLMDNKPLTLIYETMSLKSFEKANQSDLSLKKEVSRLLQNMTWNKYHQRFLNIGVKNIITTNYDYSFEKAGQTLIDHANVKRETRYSSFRRTRVGKTYVWHVHGEVEETDSIMLGFEQYSGYLQKIRNYVVPPQKKRFLVRENLERIFDRNQTNSWVDLFLRDEIHILGFGMDYSEMDIWWLIAYKAQCKARHGMEPGKTVYYHWTDKEKNERDEAKLQLLEALDVVVYKKYLIDSFQVCYDKFLEDFKVKVQA